ncbi:Immunoglobulin superfamily member 3 [Labeo rohita]|nr:Immunoglobulin superfamily member 3 [Labeo rohita]
MSVGSWHEESTGVCGRTGVTGGKETDKLSEKSHFHFTTGWPRDADACAYLEIRTRRDVLADGLRLFVRYRLDNDIRGTTFSLFSQLQLFTLVFLYPTFLSNTDRLGRLGTCSAQRQVTVQPGPIIRTEGSHITIWCNVTGYKEGVEQDFEWSMYLYTAPDREIRIVSTSQHNYAYALYSQRVNSKEIYIERLSGDSVLLHITKLQATDQGMYECYTPNTDSRYLGSYSARTNLTGEPPPNFHLTLIYNVVCFQQHCGFAFMSLIQTGQVLPQEAG